MPSQLAPVTGDPRDARTVQLENEEGFREFSESLIAGIDEVFFWRNPGERTPYFVSHSYERIWGHPCGSVYTDPSTWLESIHPDDRERVQREFASADNIGEGQFEYRITRGDGEDRWISIRTFPYREASGILKRIIGIAQDCTDRINAQKSQAFLASIVESSDDSIIGTDLQGNVLSWNQGAEMLFEYTAEEIIGKHISLLFPQGDMDAAVATLDKIRAHVRIERFDSIRISKSGRAIDVSTILSPIMDSFGKLQGVSAIYRDITELKRRDAELYRMKEAAEAANRAKSEFLANMSHEIRTPMNGIIGMSEILLETELSDEQRDYLGIVKSSADLLLTVVNDILDFSKIEAGRLELDPFTFNIRDRIEETERALAMRAHEKGLELICDISPEVPEQIIGDYTRIHQILVNLLGNAIKFTEAGEVSLQVGVERRQGMQVVMRFSVRDTGIGIPIEKQQMIFNPFSQVDGSTTRKYGGTGLGLAISSRLVEKMKGKIWLESREDQGSQFFFTVQLEVANEQPEPFTDSEVNLTGMRVLVVDDNLTNRLILSDLLRSWGMQPTAVANGPEAIAHLRHAAEHHDPYMLVLTDLHMPEMDGFTFVDRIRSTKNDSGAFILMLTSGEQVGDVARCQQLGVSAYLTKPVRRIELRRAIIAALSKRRCHAKGSSAVDSPSPIKDSTDAGKVILLVEDNFVNQCVTRTMLEKAGHHVTVAEDGPKAIRIIKEQRFDLILMDVQLPGMDGYETTASIREAQKAMGTRTAIIAMTAHAMTGDRERCLAAGMDEYISKPVNRDRLFDTMTRCLADNEPELL